MKKIILVLLTVVCVLLPVFSQEEPNDLEDGYVYEHKEKVYPSAKRPKKPSSAQIADSEAANPEKAGADYAEECRDTFKYGLTDEVASLLDELTANKDVRFVDEVYDLFLETKSPRVRLKALSYFEKLEDPCLEDYAVAVINDPYDEKKDIVQECFKYVAAVKSTDAVAGVVDILEREDEDFFAAALSCLGDIGGTDEARLLTQYFDRDDLSTAKRQSLMRVLGKLKAIETWDALSDIAQDSDEDLYVRCYAAQAIGAMEVPESEDILIDLFEADEPKLREYVVMGLSHYKSQKAHAVIIQALKDDNYRVRLEAIGVVEEHNLTEASKDLVYHCKHKEETVVKDKCYKVLAKLGTAEGNEYLVSVIQDKKAGDSTRAKVAAALLENGSVGTKEILELAQTVVADDKSKNLRYAIGKELAKYDRSEFAEVCLLYLQSKDAATQGTGLDIYARGRYSSATAKVQEIAQPAYDAEAQEKAGEEGANKKKITPSANAKKAKRILENK